MVTVDQMDAHEWLKTVPPGPLVTMMPDAHEVEMSARVWTKWFNESIHLCLEASPETPVVFAQTDRKRDGQWISKAEMVMVAAEVHSRPLLWHRIALRRDAGKVDIHRPGYTHLIAVGPGRPGKPEPDVLPPSPRTWANGAPVGAARMIARFMAGAGYDRVLNPFCGEGAFLAALAEQNIEAHGCDLDADRAEKATWLKLEEVTG